MSGRTNLHGVDGGMVGGSDVRHCHFDVASFCVTDDGKSVGDADGLAGIVLGAIGVGLDASLATHARRARLPKNGEQVVAELAAGQHVHDEVDGRVKDGHEVADRRVVVVPAAALTLVLVDDRPDDAVDERWSLTDDEDEDDSDQHDGEVLLLLLLLVVSRRRHGNSSHLPPPSALLFQRSDQLGVEERQKYQWTSQHHDEVKDVVVDDAKDAVFADGAEEVHRRGKHGLVVRRRTVDVDATVLEESRDVVENCGGGHVGDVTLNARQRAQSGRAVRLTDGRVAVKRDEHRQQDGSRQGHQVQRPQVQSLLIVDSNVQRWVKHPRLCAGFHMISLRTCVQQSINFELRTGMTLSGTVATGMA